MRIISLWRPIARLSETDEERDKWTIKAHKRKRTLIRRERNVEERYIWFKWQIDTKAALQITTSDVSQLHRFVCSGYAEATYIVGVLRSILTQEIASAVS